MIQTIRFFFEIFSLPDVKVGTWRLFRHRLTAATYRPFTEVLLLVVEPSLTLAALGIGLGQWLNEIDGKPYAAFVLPAVVALTTVFIPFWETAYGVFSRLKSPQAYWAIMQSPLDLTEIATGEILWATAKGVVSGALLLAIGFVFGWCTSPWAWLGILALIPGAMFFAAVGLWGASLARRSMTLLMLQSFVLGPLALWSDTIFPFSRMGEIPNILVWASPVTHIVRPLRNLCAGEITSEIFLNLAVIWLIGSIAVNAAAMAFGERLNPK